MKTVTMCGSMKFEKEMQQIIFSDTIYVVDIHGYIGNQVCKEIEFAKCRGKEIMYHSQYKLS